MDFEQFKNLLKEELKNLSIDISDVQVKQFYTYMNLLVEWNKKINLTAITEANEIITKHFIDSLIISKYLQEGKNVMDIGTGAGFPGIPLKIINNNIHIDLVDSLNKRITFLNEVITKLELNDINAIHSRAEDLARIVKYRENYDIVVSRAVARLNILDELCLPLVKVNGYFLALKGLKAKEELKEASNGIKVLGGRVDEVIDFTLTNDDHRSNIIIKKVKATPGKYPRMFSKIKKQPL